LVTDAATTFFFDCQFDSATDDYPEYFAVYRMPVGFVPPSDGSSWSGLERLGEWLRMLPVKDVRFDTTRRAAMDASALEVLSLH
jgi:hypothetical protein